MVSRLFFSASCCAVAVCLGCGSGAPPQADRTAQTPPPTAAPSDKSALEPVPGTEDTPEPGREAAEQAFARLIEASQDSDPDEWSQAVSQINELGEAAVPVLADHLNDSNPFAREMAAQFLAQLGSAAASAEPKLIAMLQDDSPTVRLNSAAALLSMNSSSKEIVAALEGLLNDPDETLRLPAAVSLAGEESASRKAIETLTALLSAENVSVRLGAVEALGRLGPKAVDSLAAVRQLNQDHRPEVQAAARAAAERIESSGSETIPASGEEP